MQNLVAKTVRFDVHVTRIDIMLYNSITSMQRCLVYAYCNSQYLRAVANINQ